MGKIRKGRSEREDVSVITVDWVEKHQHILTSRDVAMLQLLKEFPVMTVHHLVALTPETILPNGKVLEPFYKSVKGHKLCRDRIRRLFDTHFVNKFSPRLGLGEGTSPQYIWLDRAGYRYFGLDGRPPKTLSTEYRHHTKILDTYIYFIELERRGVIKIDYMKVCYGYKPQTANIEPDLIVCFQKGNYGYKYFIEVDTGEKKETDELKKVERYRNWELSGQWIKEEWANLYKRKFPTVLYVFTDSKKRLTRRINGLESKAREVECKYDGIKEEELASKLDSLKA